MDRRRRRARRIRFGVAAFAGCLVTAAVQVATHGPVQAAGAYGATANAAGLLTTTQDPSTSPLGR